jgi:hypothetical protein
MELDWKALRLKYILQDAPLWHRLWSVRIAIFWAILGGLWVALPAFQVYIHPVVFAVICVGFSLAILFARVTKQPGLPDL